MGAETVKYEQIKGNIGQLYNFAKFHTVTESSKLLSELTFLLPNAVIGVLKIVHLLLYFGIAVVLWSGCFSYWVIHLTRRQIDPRQWTDCKLYYFMLFFGRNYSSTLLVLMSIEKCFAVYFPLKAKTVCTVRTAKWATGAAGVVLAAFNAINFFLESDFIKSSGRHICLFNFDRNVVTALTTVDSVLYSFGPFTLMFITNFAIVFKFMRAKCNQRNSTESTNQALSKSATRGTAMVVTVSVTFLILTVLSAVDMALWPNIKLSENVVYNVIMNFPQYLSHSINGVLYLLLICNERHLFRRTNKD